MQGKYISKYFRESDTFSFAKLKRDLAKLSTEGIADEELLKIITILKNKRVIIQYRSKEEQESYKNDFDYDDLNYDNLDFSKIDLRKQQIFVIRYVGIIIIHNYVFKCFPKYIEESTDKGDFNKVRIDKVLKKIVPVLRKYNSRQERLFSATSLVGEKDFDFLSIAIFFLNDYLDNGFYYNEKHTLEINGGGEINWSKTIDETDPIVTDKGPVYIELYTEFTEVDNNDFFRRLHLYIVSYCAKLLGAAGLFDVLSIDGDFDFDIDKDTLGDDDFILDRIQREMSIQFVTKKQELLEKMYTFISQKNSLDKEYELSLYGTTHFHTVWEDVCRDTLDNQLDIELRHLPCQSRLDYSKLANSLYQLHVDDENLHRAIRRLKEIHLNKFIEKPVWYVSGSTQKHESNKTYIPDLLQLYERKDVLYFNILDAKYRSIVLNNQSLKNAPGVEEITKQYLYQLVFCDLINSYTFKNTHIKITNSFLFPGDSDNATILGMAEIRAMRNIHLENISAIKLPASVMYDLYINNMKVKNVEELLT